MSKTAKILGGIAAMALVIPLMAATLPPIPASYGHPAGPGWNDREWASVDTYIVDQAPAGSVVPFWACASYGPNPLPPSGDPEGHRYGWPGVGANWFCHHFH